MPSRVLLSFLLSCCLLPIDPTLADEQAAAPLVFFNGANSLFCGHSFFIPIARLFSDYSITLSSAASVNYEFPRHNVSTFFRGGVKGSPLSLWNNNKGDIEPLLAAGDWDLFGLTIHSDDPDPIIRLQNWFDLAKSYNPNITFFLGLPWPSDGARTSDKDYRNTTSVLGQKYIDIVTNLRHRYSPDNPVLMLHYGHAVVRMRDLFQNGTGPLTSDVTALLGTPDTAIYRDVSPGHAGAYAQDMSAFLWMHWIYGVSVDHLVRMSGRLWSNTSNVRDILEYALERNQEYTWRVGDESLYANHSGGGDSTAESGGQEGGGEPQPDASSSSPRSGFFSRLWFLLCCSILFLSS